MQTEPQLSAEMEAALKDLENEAHIQGWEGVNDKNLKIANKVVREVIATALEEQRTKLREEVEKHKINLGARRVAKIYKDNEEQYWYDKGQNDEVERVLHLLERGGE